VSSSGAPQAGPVDGSDVRLGIVVARWHGEITERLLDGALKAAAEAGVRDRDVHVARVPGAFELPVAVQAMADRPGIDGVVALAVVVRGGTPHFEYVCHAVTDGCTRVALDTGKPVGFGVLTVDDVAQAEARAGGDEGDKGREAVQAVLETVRVLTKIRTDRKA
jgi:6,7-dimethyl-8-ribityllumazine synthase